MGTTFVNAFYKAVQGIKDYKYLKAQKLISLKFVVILKELMQFKKCLTQ